MTPPAATTHVLTRRHRIRHWAVRIASACLVLLLLSSAATYFVSLGGAATSSTCSAVPASSVVLAGAARADITPRQPVYLGGYGIGPVRRSTGSLQPLYVRTLAIRSSSNARRDTLVFAAIDSQGYFAAYQSGPYGLDDVRAAVQARLGIPADHVVISSTHSHAAPDTVGFWGGVPDDYLAQVHDAALSAITSAVMTMEPSRLSVGTASIAGYTSSFGEGERGQGQGAAWPTDSQVRVLHVSADGDGHTLATIANVSVHATVLGADNTLAAPDWPGAAADDLERALGGVAIVMVGAVGHTWPGTPPGETAPATRVDAMLQYAAIIASRVHDAIATAVPVTTPTLCAASERFREADTSAPLLLGLQLLGRPGHERILRALGAPYFVPPAVLGVEVTALRVGDVLFLAAPVEPYPSLLFALRQRVQFSAVFVLGLANDDLGYATLASEYGGAVAASPADEALFIINPTFGDTLVQHLADAAARIVP